MHIVYVCHEYPPATFGGIGATVATVARGMARAGHRVSVVGVYPEASIEQTDGVRIHRIAAPHAPRGANWCVARLRVHRAIRELHATDAIDVVEWPDFYGWFWRPVDGVADVVKVHGTLMSHRLHGLAARRPLIERLELRTLRRVRNWVGVSRWFNAEWKRIARVRPRREAIVYNPVDLALFRPPDTPRDPGLVLYAGGLKTRKGVRALARAARIFLPACPGARLVLVGFPADLSEEQVREEAGPVNDRVEFVPFLSQAELASYMRRASVYAMPSEYESCGNTWIEAAACETPTLGSTRSCGPEIVVDEQTGLLADPADPEDVATKIVRLLRDRAAAHELGLAAARRARELFSLDVALRVSQPFYDDCARAARS